MPSESFTCARCGLFNDRQGFFRLQRLTVRDLCDACFLDRHTGKTDWFTKAAFMGVYTFGGLAIWLDGRNGMMSQAAATALLTLPGLGIAALLWRQKGRKK